MRSFEVPSKPSQRLRVAKGARVTRVNTMVTKTTAASLRGGWARELSCAPTLSDGQRVMAAPRIVSNRAECQFGPMPFFDVPQKAMLPAVAVDSGADAAEREADRVAVEVMQMQTPKGCPRTAVTQPERVNSVSTSDTGLRSPSSSAKRRQVTSLSDPAPSGVQRLLQQINVDDRGGQPINDSTRRFFEPRFGCDFSKVRIHEDKRANLLSSALQARAFTFGKHIFFARGAHDPRCRAGRKLIAHELAHVVQQNGRFPRVQRERARRPVHLYSIPIPRAARGTPSGGRVYTLNGVAITILPDERTTDPSWAGTACVRITPQRNVPQAIYDNQGLVRRIQPAGPWPLRLTMRAIYGPGGSRTSRAVYGRGSTPQDIQARNYTLGFHERCHGADVHAYIQRHRPAAFRGLAGMTRLAFAAAIGQFTAASQSYVEALTQDTRQRTDCAPPLTIDRVCGTNFCTGGSRP